MTKMKEAMQGEFKLKVPDDVRNLIFFCEGGIGKNIAATTVVRMLKQQFPDKKIIVVASFPDIFIHNPHVHQLFNFNNALHFYENWIDRNPDSMVLRCEPYYHRDYIRKTKHLIVCWCEMLGIEIKGNLSPDVFLTPNEDKAAELYVNSMTDNRKKRLAMFQWIGGKIPQKENDEKEIKMHLAEMYRRAIPKQQAQDIVDFLVKNDCEVALLQHPNFPNLNGAKALSIPSLRAVIALLKHADYFVGIDSFAQHAAACNQILKPGMVIWGGTSATCLGYPIHHNWEVEECPTPACHRPNSYLMDMQVNGQMWDCPWGETCMKRTMDDFAKHFMNIYGHALPKNANKPNPKKRKRKTK